LPQQKQSPAQQNQRPDATKSKSSATKSKSVCSRKLKVYQPVTSAGDPPERLRPQILGSSSAGLAREVASEKLNHASRDLASNF
jgi:hypothetical protein